MSRAYHEAREGEVDSGVDAQGRGCQTAPTLERSLAFLAFAALTVTLAGPADGAPPASPNRVASLNLTADEILVEILPPGRLVAVTRWADDPSMSTVAGRVPSSAVRFPKAELERLVALAPDLVVVSEYTDADFLKLLEQSGLHAHRMTGLDTLAGQRQAIRALGRAVGEPEAADRLAAHHEETLKELDRRLQGAPRPRMLYWANPYTAGAGTAIGALIEAAGAENLGRSLGLTGIVPLSGERAYAADPDVILLGRYPGTLEALRADPLLSRLRAVREGRIIEIPTGLLVTLSHHSADACWYLAAALHPDRVPRKQ
jgi:iron complex transport system substrate-binding protein